MKRTVIEAVKTCARPVKRALELAIDNRLVDYHMPLEMPGDILITFDDGPHPEYTPLLLNLLDRYGVKAMFFVIGERAEKNPDLVKAYHEQGHIVANHTYSHLNDVAGARYSRDRVVEDINKCSDLVESTIGKATRQFRPPRGELNIKTWRAARDTDHSLMLWSIEGGEWGKRSDWSAEDISDFVTSNIKKRDILLLHDDNEKSLVVISDLLESLRKRKLDLNSAIESVR
ncbi:MAG: polysaccharide deacetylase family protein [Hyphomicrobiales bacterium]|nr:polysaccharide deacetylase family protein [Hyphomicrobiales bacterium]